jgi:hypothetical protein
MPYRPEIVVDPEERAPCKLGVKSIDTTKNNKNKISQSQKLHLVSAVMVHAIPRASNTKRAKQTAPFGIVADRAIVIMMMNCNANRENIKIWQDMAFSSQCPCVNLELKSQSRFSGVVRALHRAAPRREAGYSTASLPAESGTRGDMPRRSGRAAGSRRA